jgi:hypothetical protein
MLKLLHALPGYFATLHLYPPKKQCLDHSSCHSLFPLIRSPFLRLVISFGYISMSHALITWDSDSTQRPIAHPPALIRTVLVLRTFPCDLSSISAHIIISLAVRSPYQNFNWKHIMVLAGSATFPLTLRVPRRFGSALPHMRRRSYHFIPDLRHSGTNLNGE